jgi:hypothetical protein
VDAVERFAATGAFSASIPAPEPAPKATTVVLSFPIANAITADSIRALAAALEKERAVPVAG